MNLRSIKEIASIQLSSVIGSHTRQELFPATSKIDHSAKLSLVADEDEDEIGIESSGHQKETDVEAEIHNKIKDQLTALGINLIKVSIKNLDMIDKTLAHELGQGAVIESQTNSKLLTAQSDAEILRISSKAEAAAITTKAEATAKAAALLTSTPFATELEFQNKQIQLVGAAKPGTQLHYGANGPAGFFQSQHNHSCSFKEAIKPDDNNEALPLEHKGEHGLY